jgi:hypothetical protein
LIEGKEDAEFEVEKWMYQGCCEIVVIISPPRYDSTPSNVG